MSDFYVVPCARLVPLELQVEFGPVPSGMVPLRGRPVLDLICRDAAATGSGILLALHDGAQEVDRWLSRQSEVAPRSVDVGETSSLGETVLVALDSLPDDVGRLVVHFADTLIGGPNPDGDFVSCRFQADTYRYTTFAVEEASGAIAVTSERQEDVGTPAAQLVFAGRFGIAAPIEFAEILRDAVEVPAEEGVDPFYRALCAYSARGGRRMSVHQVETWHDVGHLDTYYETKRSMFLGARDFNSVAVDSARGVIRKSSDNTAKFLDEVLWYLRLPSRLKHVAPRILDYSLDPLEPWVEMEFYGYPALNDAYLVGQWDVGVWSRVLSALTSLLAELQAHRLAPPDPGELRSAAVEMYVDKTRERLAALQASEPPWLLPMLAKRVVVNGRTVRGISALEADLESLVRELGLLDLDSLSVIHGDLCLSNLLYDRRSGIVRTIDPRGRFGSFDVYGDPLYDLAKLSHSFHGDYDLILAGRFDLDHGPDGHVLVVHLTEAQRRVKLMFEAWLARTCPDRVREVRLIEGLLFCSMVPLHADNPQAQEAFVLRGLELVEEATAGV